jgi:hypothetical protein
MLMRAKDAAQVGAVTDVDDVDAGPTILIASC